jgi:hypothetical protein
MSYKSNDALDQHIQSPDELGFLILSEKGAILSSGGQLSKDEKTAHIFMKMVKQLSWFGGAETNSIGDFNTLTINFQNHFYFLGRGNQKITIVKKKISKNLIDI